MDSRIAVLAMGLLAGCATQITRGANDVYTINEVGTDNLRTDSGLRSRHYAQAARICGESKVYVVDVVNPDKLFRFQCIAPERSTAQEMADARQAWLRCLEREEPAVDDMLSDGHTVAAVLATRCEAEVQTLLELGAKGYRNAYVPEDALQTKRRQVALDVVLQKRALKRNPGASMPPVAVPSLGPGG